VGGGGYIWCIQCANMQHLNPHCTEMTPSALRTDLRPVHGALGPVSDLKQEGEGIVQRPGGREVPRDDQPLWMALEGLHQQGLWRVWFHCEQKGQIERKEVCRLFKRRQEKKKKKKRAKAPESIWGVKSIRLWLIMITLSLHKNWSTI